MMSSVRKSNSYLIYTTEEGGEYKVLGNFTLQNWLQLLRDGYFLAVDVSRADYDDEFPPYIRIYPAFAEYAKGDDNRDFIIAERNGLKLPPEITEFDIRRKERYEN